MPSGAEGHGLKPCPWVFLRPLMSAAPCCSQAAVGRSCARAAGPRAHSAAVSHGLGTEGSAGRLESRACPQRREAVQRAQGGGARRGQGIAWGPHFPAWALRGAREDAPRRIFLCPWSQPSTLLMSLPYNFPPEFPTVPSALILLLCPPHTPLSSLLCLLIVSSWLL